MGAKRGQRNRDQDRYWHERRKAHQGGMVGADVGQCIFCSRLVPRDDVYVGAGGDEYCRTCGDTRGLISRKLSKGTGVELLQSIGALGEFTNRRGGPGGTATAKIVGFATNNRVDPITRKLRLRASLLGRAMLWLSRDKTVDPNEVEREALTVIELGIGEARAAIADVRATVYRQQHPRRQSEMPRKMTLAQVLDARARYSTGLGTYKLAREFGVTQAHMFCIVTGSCYKSAGGPIHVPKKDLVLRKAMGW